MQLFHDFKLDYKVVIKILCKLKGSSFKEIYSRMGMAYGTESPLYATITRFNKFDVALSTNLRH